MATIRVRDWTKEQIEEIREAESHSSHDSVIKALLKDRELAQFAGTATEEAKESDCSASPQHADTLFDDLTVLAELEHVDNGVVFFWCPNCASEIAHIGFDDDMSMSVIEIECQRCLARLDQYVVVGIEVGYPIEERIVEETLEEDLKRCVVDYWDRSLEAVAAGDHDDDQIETERRVWKYNEYLQEFGWSWPSDVPVVGVRPEQRYRNTVTGDRFDVLESITDTRGAVDDYRIRRYSDEHPDGDTSVLDATELTNLVVSRSLSVVDTDRNESPPSRDAA
ncbi:hypothetical protein [Salinibaculum salinum]|uniref:hypothetical protein n=1 Tax=Salinibaculum salinum TaxID=3131996 RepID=UPI0030ED5457